MFIVPPYLTSPPVSAMTEVIVRVSNVTQLTGLTEPPPPHDPDTVTYRQMDIIDRPVHRRDPRPAKKAKKASRPRWRQ